MNELSEIKNLLEISIQQKSASDSDIKRDIIRIKDHLAEQDKTLERMLEQTTKTNGNVRSLQIWQATGEGWIKGFGVTVACIIGLVGIIYFSMTNQEQKTQSLLEKHIVSTK